MMSVSVLQKSQLRPRVSRSERSLCCAINPLHNVKGFKNGSRLLWRGKNYPAYLHITPRGKIRAHGAPHLCAQLGQQYAHSHRAAQTQGEVSIEDIIQKAEKKNRKLGSAFSPPPCAKLALTLTHTTNSSLHALACSRRGPVLRCRHRRGAADT